MTQSKVPLWKELWEETTPIWMFRSRPEDFLTSEYWTCPGPFWLQGWIGLLGLHLACFAIFFKNVFQHSYRPELLMYLAPLLPLWLLFVSADIKYRLQKPTKAQRTAFDKAVLNHCGFITTALGFIVGIPALLFSFLAFLWRGCC